MQIPSLRNILFTCCCFATLICSTPVVAYDLSARATYAARYTQLRRINSAAARQHLTGSAHRVQAAGIGVLHPDGPEVTCILQVPCIAVRENTKRPNTVRCGTNDLVGNDRARLLRIAGDAESERLAQSREPDQWDGRAADRIAAILRSIVY